MENNFFSVVIPVFNSDESLPILVDRLSVVFDGLIKSPFEVIFVDDGSKNPNTWTTLRMLAQENKNVVALKLQKNFGKASAVLCGFNHVTGNFVITMDDDLQHAPEDITFLVKEKNHDVVMAAFNSKKHSTQQKITSYIKSWFDVLSLGKPKEIYNSPFRLIKRDVLEKMLKIQTSYPIVAAMIYYTTDDIVNVFIEHNIRKYGKSDFNLRKRWRLFTNLLINNSNFGLRLLRYGGMGVSIISFLLSLYYVIRKIFFQVNTAGFTTLVTINLLIGGLILLSIGVLGEYIYRLLVNIEQKPPYVVRYSINYSNNQNQREYES